MANKSLMEHLIAIVKKSKEVTLPKYTGKNNLKSTKPPKQTATQAVDTPAAVPHVKAQEVQERDVRAQFYMRIGASVSNKTKGRTSLNAVAAPATSTPKKKEGIGEEEDLDQSKDAGNSESTMESDVWNGKY